MHSHYSPVHSRASVLPRRNGIGYLELMDMTRADGDPDLEVRLVVRSRCPLGFLRHRGLECRAV
jgi:hypothetical protein